MVQLAALLFRVKVGEDKSQTAMIPKMLKELVPNDMLKAMSADEWRKVSKREERAQSGTDVVVKV